MVHRADDRSRPDERHRRCAARRRRQPGLAGQLRLIEGNQPVYLCSLRDEQQQLLAILSVLTRPSDALERKVPDFSFVYSLLSPALECLRRDLLAQRTIEELNQTVGGLDKDLNLLLSQGAAQTPQQAADGANELTHLLQQTIEHLHACTGALLVPEKSVTLVRSGDALSPPDTQFLMRAHRRLLRLAQSQREPVVVNDTQSPENPDGFHYRVLCCALHSRSGRSIGVLALLREATADGFTPRDAHIAEILARKALGVIESSYDALSGLYTRPEFEQRVRTVIADRKPTQAWSVCTSTSTSCTPSTRTPACTSAMPCSGSSAS